MSDLNVLSLACYSSGTTRITDPRGELKKAQDIQFETCYPGGLYAGASFYVPRNVVNQWELNGGKRIVIYNDLTVVYEGFISGLPKEIEETAQGVRVNCIGGWGHIMMNRRWDKRWADNRIDQAVWVVQTTATANEICNIDRNARIRFTPKAEAWANNQYAAVRYIMPTGETAKKIVYDYAMAEGAQAWDLAIRSVTGGDEVNITASGTGTNQTLTFATPTQLIELRFYARAAQTPTSDGTYYGQFSNIVVYSEASAIDLTEILTDIIGKVTSLNSTTAFLGSNTYSLVPFISQGWDTVANTAVIAADKGDAAQNRWAVYCLNSDRAPTPNGNPVLGSEAIPALTSYDYAVRLGENNLIAPFNLEPDYSAIRNWIITHRRDENGYDIYEIPTDDATLTDAASVAAYGQHDYVLECGQLSAAAALNSGQRFLAVWKDPVWRLTASLNIKGYVRGISGNKIPASQIRAGKRIKIENFLQNLSGIGLTFLISHTNYSDNDQTCRVDAGPLVDLITTYDVGNPWGAVPGLFMR